MIRTLIFFLIVFLFGACKDPSKKTEISETTPHTSPPQGTSTWTKEDMDFQQNYCLKMMANIDDLDKEKYCQCFLEKVKYYYKPIEILHAYRQEHDFSQECMELYYKGEE